MDKKQYDELRATFPWQEQTFANGLVQVIDRNGKEVPLFTVLNFVKFITLKLEQK